MTEERKFVFVAEFQDENKDKDTAEISKEKVEIKERTREEILSEKTYKERNVVYNRMDDMQEEYENAVSSRRWDKKRECYYNREGEPVVPMKDIIFDDVLLVVPMRAEYYRNVITDDTYAKRLEKEIRYAMLSCLRKRDEERMKKNVEEMVNDLKKVAEEVKTEIVETEAVKEIKSEEVEVNEEVQKEEKNVNLKAGNVGDEVSVEQKLNDAEMKQTEAAENTEVPITENKKGIGSEFHQVPPPEKFAFYDEEKVEKAFNMVDQLPDNIDITYSKSDDSHDSEVVGKVVESVLKEELIVTGKSESQDEDEGNLHDAYLKNIKSEKKLNDDSKGLVYTMIGSDKLFLDVVFPIQNVISEKVDKVFKMVEIEKSEISKFVGKSHKGSYNKPGFKKKNMKAGLGYKKRQNRNKNETLNYQAKMSFVQGNSLAEEKELKIRRQSNAEFEAQKRKQQPQVKDVSMRTCFKCDKKGHLARKCPNLKPVDVDHKKIDSEKQKSEYVRQRSTRFDSKQTWRYNTNKFASNQNWKSNTNMFDSRQTWNTHTPIFRTTQSWKTSVDMTKPQEFWKPKNVVQNQSVQKDSHFYKRGTLKGQTWSVKKHVDSVKDEKAEVKIEKVFVKNDNEFPALNEN
ncbi:putative transcription factor interactor and regulator CCHC(Zn) family [Helianthus annuus]|nr:putative transcription factor interactor and regulator CCHC(Zn) family [Helianthus annuus]